MNTVYYLRAVGHDKLLADYRAKRASLPDAAHIYIGRRVWDVLTSPEENLVEHNPWDAQRNAQTTDGVALTVREDFDGNRIEVVTREMLDTAELVKKSVLEVVRLTRENPEAIEIGTQAWKLLSRSKFQEELNFYGGVPFKVLEAADPMWIRAIPNSRAPAWACIGKCLARKDNKDEWGQVEGTPKGFVVLDEYKGVPHAAIPNMEIRDEWELVPFRPRPRNRFARVLDEE